MKLVISLSLVLLVVTCFTANVRAEELIFSGQGMPDYSKETSQPSLNSSEEEKERLEKEWNSDAMFMAEENILRKIFIVEKLSFKGAETLSPSPEDTSAFWQKETKLLIYLSAKGTDFLADLKKVGKVEVKECPMRVFITLTLKIERRELERLVNKYKIERKGGK